jgi:ATP-dependent exoDNAse (exonuclease V) beta subunit
MHAWFECLDWLEESNPVPDVSRLRYRAMDLSIPESIAEALLPDFLKLLQHSDVRAAFDRKTAGGAPSFAAFGPNLEGGNSKLRVERERTFVLLQDGELVQGTIDRLVLLCHNNRPVAADIVDFKTDRLVGNPATWIEGKRHHYAPQLQEYRVAVSHCFGVPTDKISTRLLLLEAHAVVDA